MRIARTDFGRLLAQTIKAVESRNTIPILGHVKLVNEGGALTATATDLDVEITGTIPAEGEDMALCVDAKLLAGIVNKIGGVMLDMAHDGNRLTVKAGRSRFTLDTLPVGDFPTMNTDNAAWVEFEADLAALFAPVMFAMSNEETRYYLNGINLEPGIATATDGHRLSTNRIEPWGEHAPVIVPRKTVGLMPKGAVKVALTNTKMRVVADGVTITSKLIDGTFPDYERVVPKNNSRVVTVDNASLRAAAERVSVISAERARAVKLEIAGDAIALTMRGEGEAADEVECNYGGEPIAVGFNSAYLAEMLGNLPAGEVELHLEDAGAPALLVSKQAEGLRCVLMPMRTT